MKYRYIYLIPIILLIPFISPASDIDPPSGTRTTPIRFPLRIVKNMGQWPEGIRYMTLPGGSNIQFREDGLVFLREKRETRLVDVPLETGRPTNPEPEYEQAVLRFLHPSPRMQLREGDPSETMMHFYVGDPSRTRENVPCMQSLHYANVWEGMDLRFETAGNLLRLTSITRSGQMKSPRLILEGDASLVADLETALQSGAGGFARYHGGGGNPTVLSDTLTFHLPSRIPSDSLFLWTEFSTFFSGEQGGVLVQAMDMRADERGNVTFEGATRYPDLPVTPNAFQPNSTIDNIPANTKAVSYFGRINCDGISADYLTYYGIGFDFGYSGSSGKGVELHETGMYMITMMNNNPDVVAFNTPVGNALEHRYPLDTTFIPPVGTVLCHFDSNGVLSYRSRLSAHLGSQVGVRIGLDSHVYLYGPDAGSIPYIKSGVFIDSLRSGQLRAPFLLKLTPDCDSVVYCTYMPDSTILHDVHSDESGYASVVGMTQRITFPVKNAWQSSLRDTVAFGDQFVLRLSPTGDTLAFSTFIGGSFLDSYQGNSGLRNIIVSNNGNTYIAETTKSNDYPLFRPFQSEYRCKDFFVDRTPDLVLAGFRPNGEIIFSTYWGGDGIEVPITMDLTPCGDLLITGNTSSSDFPLVDCPSFADVPSSGVGADPRYFMLLIDPEQVAVHASFLLPGDLSVADLHYTDNGYMHRIGWAFDDFPVFNGFQDRAHSPALGAGLSRWYFPLCGEDLLRSRALIQDTIVADSVRGYLSHDQFDLEVELRNVDGTRAAYMLRSTIDLPEGLLLQHGETVEKQPNPMVIPPGGAAVVRWRVQLDTARLGGWAGLRDLLLPVRFTHEYKLSTSLASCLSSFSFNDLPLVVKRDDSDSRLACAVSATDTLHVRADGRGYEPPLLVVNGEVRNTGSVDSPPTPAVLRLGRMGPVLEPPADSLRVVPVLTPGDAFAAQWTVRPARRADTRRVALQMVVRDERGERTRCMQEIVVPGLRPVHCSLSLPDTVRIMKDGSTLPTDILARLRLENILDTLISGLEARIDLGGISGLGLAPGETAERQWDFVQGGRDVATSWMLRITEEVRVPTRVDVPVRYRCASDTTWRVCMESVPLYPLNSDLYCGITLPSTHPAALVETRAIVPHDYTLTNAGTVPVDVDQLELVIDPADAGLLALDPMTTPGTQLSAGGSLPWTVRLRAAILRNPRTVTCTVTAYGKSATGADSVLSVCESSITIEGVDGLRCVITSADTVRFERDSLRYEPDPVLVHMDLTNVLDTAENAIEAGIDLTGAPRFTLADGEIALKTLSLLDSHSVARFSWLLSPLAAATDDIQDIRIRYRSAQQGGWKECNATIVITAWPAIAEVRCATAGHDSIFADAAYELIVPEPFQLSYTATNSGTVALTGCTAAIILPPGFVLAGSDSIQSFGDDPPGNLAPGESATRWWTVTTNDQLQGFGAKDITWQWTSDQQGTGTGCAHSVQVVPDPSSGITFTPLRLLFEAELGGALPAAQTVKLWTGGGLSMPWTAQSDAWYMDIDPVAGDHAASIAVQPNTTMLSKGLHVSTLTLGGSAVNLPRSIEVDYLITSLTEVLEQPSAHSLSLGTVYPHPIPVAGEARILLRNPQGHTLRVTLHDLLGRERALLREGIITDSDILYLRPAALGLSPGSYLLRVLSAEGQQSRILTVVR